MGSNSNSYYTGGWDVNEYNRNTDASDTRKTYYGYDKDGNKVPGAKCTAKDARNDIDVVSLKKTITNAEDMYNTEFEKISKAVEDLADDTEKGLVINGLSLKSNVLDLAEEIIAMPKENINHMWSIYQQANHLLYKLQEKYNEEAKNSVLSMNNVTKVKEK